MNTYSGVDVNTPRQTDRPLFARIISMEGAMTSFGLYSLVTGLIDGQDLQIFWGVMILAGLGILIAVRRRDWQKHWEEMESVWNERRRPTPPEHADSSQREE
jgi:hypothetical protein